MNILSPFPGTGAPLTAPVEHSVDLRNVLNFTWRRWKLILAIFLTFLLAGAAYLSIQVRLYTATAQLLLDPRKEKVFGKDDVLSDFILNVATIESQISIIRSTSLLQRVVESENLVTDPEFGNPRAEAAGPGAKNASANAITTSVNRLLGRLQVQRRGQASVLLISITSMDPSKASKLANAVADAYVVDQLDARFDAARRATKWLGQRLDELKKEVRDSEEAVAKFRTENGLQQTATNVTVNQEQLNQLNSRLVAAKSEVAEKKASLDLLESAAKNGGPAPQIDSSPLLASLRTQEADISRREADLVSRYSDRHPLVVNIRAEKRDIQRAIAAELARAAEKIRNDYQIAKSREAGVERTLNEVTGQAGIDSRTAVGLRELERTADANRRLYEDFLQRAKITEQATFDTRESRIITAAVPPRAPSSPKKGQTMMIMALAGLVIGFGCAVALEILNAGFNTPKQIEEILGLPVLASISRMTTKDLTVGGKQVPITILPSVRPLSRYSEAIRSLRSGIQMTDVDHPPKVLQVTSTLPGEGKTAIALSLAASAGHSKLKVLLIDADLRNPSASRILSNGKDGGLVDLLLQQRDVKEVVRYYEPGQFWTLTAGSKTQNPSDLLGSERMRSLIASFASTFDYVILDTPPLAPVIDPIIVSQFVDKVVYVVRWAATPRETVELAVRKITQSKKIAGVVLNHTDDQMLRKYGNQTYAYYGSSKYSSYYSE